MPSGHSRFNGATPMVAWKAAMIFSHHRQRVLLQWGHADGGVEGVGPVAALGRVIERFNGATPMVAWKALST